MSEKSAAGADLQAALDRFVADYRLPAASAAVVCDNELAWRGETGLADAAARRPADPDVFTVEPGSNFAGEDVVFRRLAGGRVGSVLLVETSYARLDPAVGSPG